MGFSRPRRSKNPARTCRIPALSPVTKIVGFGPENPFRFTGPKHRPIVGGTRVPPTSIGTFDFKVRLSFASGLALV